MRLLLSILLLCFACTAALPASAHDNNKKEPIVAAQPSFATSFVKAIIKAEPAVALRPCAQVTGSAARTNSFPGTGFIYLTAVVTTASFEVLPKHFVDPYTDHQSIALKLLFPKHYFW